MGPLETSLRHKIEARFQPLHLVLENESHTHSVPKNSETHFRAVIVSEKFAGQTRIVRQREVLAAIDQELKAGVHAFTMRCLTPEDWAADPASSFVSPACHGGSRHGQ